MLHCMRRYFSFFRLTVALSSTSLLMTACATDQEKARVHAQQLCVADPMAGMIQGAKVELEGKRKELESLKLSFGTERYTRLAKELQRYDIEHETLNQDTQVSCREWGLCDYRFGSSPGACRTERDRHDERQQAARNFFERVKQLDVKQSYDSGERTVAQHAQLGLNITVIPRSAEQTPGNVVKYFDIEFSALNSGDKTAERFYYTILVPSDLIAQDNRGLGDMSLLLDSNLKQINFEGNKYFAFIGMKGTPTFPSRKLRIGELSLRHPVRKFTLHWKLVTDDGNFPAGDAFNHIPFDLKYPGE